MNRIKKVLAKCLTAVLAMTMFFWSNVSDVQAAGTDGQHMNVVFVLDQSGSMSKTDAGNLRYEAVDLFLGLASETGNYMGAVVFDDAIVLQQDIAAIDGKQSKNALSESIKSAKSYGDTDIGKAIELATDMLQTSGNPDYRSVIILLSDGNTDLPGDTTGEALTASEQSKQNAIENARRNGINIHSVCLNANGEARKEELQEISDATGGVCIEVKSAEDLKEVFNEFYNIIYSTATINLADTVIPDNGELEIPFEVPLVGVEEANIIINTLNPDTTYNLNNPDGYGYIQAEIDDMSVKAKTFTVVKIEKPKPGNWTLIVRGVAGDQIKVDMVYNADLSIELSCDHQGFEFGPAESAEISAKLVDAGTVVTNPEVYQKYPIILSVKEKATGTSIFSSTMDVNNDVTTAAVQIENAGIYEVQAVCVIGDMQVVSEVIECNIDSAFSTAPTAAPVLAKGKDPVLRIILTVIFILIIIAMAVFAIAKSKSKTGKTNGIIRGRVQFAGYNDGFLGAPVTFDGTKGKMTLSRYLDYKEDVGVDLINTYLKAGEKQNYIYLISKNGYYTDTHPEVKNKKIRIDAEMETNISNDIDFGKYLRITYIPDDMEY